MKLKIAPSILSADRNNLQKDVNEISPYADFIHIDIMDGKFVPPITFHADEIKKIKSILPKDVHLMVEHPLADGFIDAFIDAGAANVTIHEECKDDIEECISYIKKKGINAAVSIKPKTNLETILPYLDSLDMVLIMSVEPGWAGQKFIPEILEKVKKLRILKPKMDIEIDGGINKETMKEVVLAGANVIVAGSSVFRKKDRKEAIEELRKAAE
jgi:ribulose-phosphate 3-epimerase